MKGQDIMSKVKYYLDETDQIEVDGHTLSRLYLAEHHPRLDKASQYAVFGEIRFILLEICQRFNCSEFKNN